MYGQFNPLGEASDELAHMDLIRFIGDEGHLPRNEAERQAAGYKSDSPMLYHILAGVITGWIDYDVLTFGASLPTSIVVKMTEKQQFASETGGFDGKPISFCHNHCKNNQYIGDF